MIDEHRQALPHDRMIIDDEDRLGIRAGFGV